jgi:hypothetical protein
MPYTACPGKRRCSEPSPLVKARAQRSAGHRCCPLLSPTSCPRHPPRAPHLGDDLGCHRVDALVGVDVDPGRRRRGSNRFRCLLVAQLLGAVMR